MHHTGRFSPIDVPGWKTVPNIHDDIVSLGQSRWEPIPAPVEDLT